MPEQQTRLNRSWAIKITIFTVALFGLGTWGLIDALIVYPTRGFAHAEWSELQYLDKARETGSLATASVREPAEELAALRATREEFESPASPRQELRELRFTWLRSLERVGALDAARTTIVSPRQRLAELEAKWDTRNPPKPLEAYDIPFQWFLVALGYGFTIYLLSLVWRVSRRTFAYDPETHALTLPDGRRFGPFEIEEVDKRKWHKFFVTLRMKEGPPVTLDLLRYTPLEKWVLEMEKLTDGYVPEQEDAEDVPEAAAGHEPSSAERAS